MKTRFLYPVLVLLVVLGLVTVEAPPARAQSVPAPVPPVLLGVEPASGSSWDGRPVEWTFDRDVAISDSGASPAMPGAWTVEGDSVTFTPSSTPDAGVSYRLFFDVATASEEAGEQAEDTPEAAPGTPVEVRLRGASPLQVTSTQPSDGATEVGVESRIVVSFNRPVVPLVGVEEQASLPQPLHFDPPVAGAGEWLGTSIYSFTPQPGLAGAATYDVSVDALTAVGGESMTDTVTFAFTTAEPIVTDAFPMGNQVSPNSPIRVYFSQPMDRASTEAAFALIAASSGESQPGELKWNEVDPGFTFTPTAPLALGDWYTIRVDQSAQPASQVGTLRASFSSEFQVVPLPAVLRSTPTDGEEGVQPDQALTVYFASPMSRTLLMPAISISPPITASMVYSYYNEWTGELTLGWPRLPGHEYAVTIGGEAEDLYGNALGDDVTIRFATGDFAPFVRVDLDQYTHFTPISTTYASVFYRNMDGLDLALYRLPISDFINVFNGPNSWSVWDEYSLPDREANLVWTRTFTTTETRNETYERIVTLDDGEGNPLPPGIYLLETQLPEVAPAPTSGEARPTRQINVVVVSDTNVVVKKSTRGNSLAWLTDVRSGTPVQGRQVNFHAAGYGLGEATSDQDGAAVRVLDIPQDAQWLPLVAISGEPGDADFAVATSDWNKGIAIWDFNINGGYNPEEYQSVFYTERPIYRPGQTVFWKGIVRRLVDNQYQLPDQTVPMTITVRDDRGNTLSQQLASFGEFGTIHGEFDLPPDAFTGYYYLEALLPLGGDQTFYSGTGFQVATYRKPEFELALTPSQEDYSQGDTITVTGQADYYSGGAMANAPLTWRVVAEPFTFNWADAPQGRWFSFEPFDPESDSYDPYAPVYFYGLVKEGTGTTGDDGSFTLELPADLGEAMQSQRWTVDVTVQSPTNQFVNQTTTFPVHRSDFYIGVGPQSNLSVAGEESQVDVVAVDTQGEVVGGVDVDVAVYEYRWNSVQERGADGRFVWQSSVERVPVSNESVRTGQDGMATIFWTPPKGGQYQIVATAVDESGNSTSSAAFVYASDPAPNASVSWRRENHDRIELVADKETYEPGDTAHILVPNPFMGPVTALVTYERSGVDHHESIEIEGGGPTLDVPIDVDSIPNFFVGVVLVKGIDKTNPSPAIRVGIVEIDVDTAAKELTIDAQPELGESAAGEANLSAEPGQTVTWTVTVFDEAGKPVADSEVSIAVVDKALLALADSAQSPLIESFYRTRPLGISTGATLIINRDRVSQQLSEGAKGGGGGGDGGMLEVREDFPDTAFWRADFVTDGEGQFSFVQVMPDNLTTWRLFARAVTADTLVGDGETDLVASKDLQVRPLLPRFFTEDDRARIGAVVLNTTDQPASDGSFSVEAEGAVLEGETEFALDLRAGGSANFDFPISIPDGVDAVTITMSAVAGDLSDAVRMVLPVERYRTPEVVATSGVVEAAEVVESVLVPAEAETGSLVVRVEPSLAAGMVDGLDFLEHYAWECNEQTVSRFLPNLFTVRAMRMLNIHDAELEAQLAYQLGVGVQKLVSRQNADGGWGYWPGESSQVFVSSYVLWGLANAAGLGFPVPGTVLDRAVGYLERSYVAPDDVDAEWQLNQMAFTHFVLSEMGEGDPGRMSTLFDQRERLQNYGKALLAMALHNVEPADERVGTLLDDLAAAASVSATGAWWNEPVVDWQTLNTDLRSTALALTAFTRVEPENPLLPNVVRWLMSAREQGHWSNTQESAWSIIGLTDWMATTGELDADYDWSVTLNDDAMGSGHFDASTLREPVTLAADIADLLRDEANILRLARSDDPGRMYYSTWLNYTLDALAIEARDRGIVVDRRFEVDGRPVSSAKVGDIISVTVTIVAPTSLHQLRVDAPIPAGVEIIDPNLAGSPAFDSNGNPLQGSSRSGWVPTYRDFRDERVALFDTYTPAGTYQYTFKVRATTPGEFRVLPAYAEMMYFTEVWGRSAGEVFTVTP